MMRSVGQASERGVLRSRELRGDGRPVCSFVENGRGGVRFGSGSAI